jgi:hypothetical protein
MAGADTGNQLPSLQDLGELRHCTQEDILLTVSRTSLFQELEPTEIQFLARFMRVYRADKGAVVFREGERGDYMLLVAAGSIEVFGYLYCIAGQYFHRADALWSRGAGACAPESRHQDLAAPGFYPQ